jgi:hypothetical protein
MNTITRPAAIAPLPVDRGSRRLSVTAGIGYLLSWLVGLLVFSSSTQVRSSGAQVRTATPDTRAPSPCSTC